MRSRLEKCSKGVLIDKVIKLKGYLEEKDLYIDECRNYIKFLEAKVEK